MTAPVYDPNMANAKQGEKALSAEYNRVVNNVKALYQKNLDQDSWITQIGNPTKSRVDTIEPNYADRSRKIAAGTGLTGGGDLTADRSLAVVYGTTAGTSVQGNDSRVTITQDAAKGNNALDTRTAALEGGRSARYFTRVVLAADQTDNVNANYYKVVWPAPEVNSGFTWNAARDAFSAPVTGWYSMGLSMRFDGVTNPDPATSDRGAWVSLSSNANAARLVWAANTGTPRSGEWPKVNDSQPVYLTAGTLLSVWAYQNSGGNLLLRSFGGACALNVAFIGN